MRMARTQQYSHTKDHSAAFGFELEIGSTNFGVKGELL